MEVELHVTFRDDTSAFQFPFAEFPFVTIRRLKEIIAERHGVQPGTNLRIFRSVSPPESPAPQFEELANLGNFYDYNVQRGALLVASTQPLVVPQKNITEAEINSTIHIFNWVPPRGTELAKMVADIREVFSSFGPIHRVILTSLVPTQQEFSAVVTFETRDTARAAAAALQSLAIMQALQEVTLLNKGISVFTAVPDVPEAARDAEPATPTPVATPVAAVADASEGKEEEEEEEATTDENKVPVAAGGAAGAAAEAQTPSARALQMAKSQLIHGYLDGRQGVALISWTAEPVPLRALMGRAAAEPWMSHRVKAWAAEKAKVVGAGVSVATKNTVSWIKRATTSAARVVKTTAASAKVAAVKTAASAKVAAAKTAASAKVATDKVKAHLFKNKDAAAAGAADGSGSGGDVAAEGDDEDDEPAYDERQLYFLRQAEAAAEAAAAAAAADEAAAPAPATDADGASATDAAVATEAAADAAEEPKPPAHLTFDDI